MPVDYIPEFSAQQMLGGWVGVYKLFSTHRDWRYIRDKETGRPKLFPSFSKAKEASREFVRIVSNPHLRHMEVDIAVDDADLLGIEEWRNGKREQLAETQILRNKKSMKRVEVVRKGQGRIRHGKAAK